MIIDCPHYKEVRVADRDGGHIANCWEEDSWDGDRDSCQVPGCSRPICDYEKNGWKGKKFVAKVNKATLDQAVKKHERLERLKPENIIKDLIERIKVLEVKVEKLQKR